MDLENCLWSVDSALRLQKAHALVLAINETHQLIILPMIAGIKYDVSSIDMTRNSKLIMAGYVRPMRLLSTLLFHSRRHGTLSQTTVRVCHRMRLLPSCATAAKFFFVSMFRLHV